ncbi:OPT oligopeptide transporter [Mycena vulgaris]|nr:OPT oligopeptide transporter [Mycena vulgaris]
MTPTPTLPDVPDLYYTGSLNPVINTGRLPLLLPVARLQMTSLAQEHVLPRDPQVLVVDEKLLQEDDDPIKSELPSVSADDIASDQDGQYDWDAEEFRDIPELVRSIVSIEDDPTLPVTTFRSVSLSLLFIILGRIVSQIGFFRTTTASFSVFFVILVSDPLGRFMARTVPEYTVPLGRFAFSLGQWATYLPIECFRSRPVPSECHLTANAKLYYAIDYSPAVALFFGWGSALIGFSFAAMCRQLLIYDPTYIFPLSLQQVMLYRSMEQNGREGADRAKRQMRGCWLIFGATFLWQFLPEYVFPFTASLAPLCWFAAHSHKANFLGSGIGGIGLLNITLYWSNITSTVITFPYSVQVIVFTAFVVTIMSNGLSTKNGSSYPFASLLSVVDGQQVFTQTKVPLFSASGETDPDIHGQYDEVGLAYAGAQYMWGIFFWYASYISAFVWFGLFVGPKLVHIYKSRRARKSAHTDRLTEWLALFTIPFIVLLVVVIKGGIYMPLFTYFFGLAFGAAATLPMASIYALSGFMLNELVYGCVAGSCRMVSKPPPATPSGSSPTVLSLVKLTLPRNVWYDCYPVLEDQKIGHYLHIPPRQVIGIQILAAFVGLPINSDAMGFKTGSCAGFWRRNSTVRLRDNANFDRTDMTGIKTDLTGQWTAQHFKSYNTAGNVPQLIFGDSVDAVAPLLIWLAHRKFPRWNLVKWNTTIFFASSTSFRGNISTGPFTSIIIGTVWNFYLFRYRHYFWKMWAYISGAALFGSTGIGMANWLGQWRGNGEDEGSDDEMDEDVEDDVEEGGGEPDEDDIDGDESDDDPFEFDDEGFINI